MADETAAWRHGEDLHWPSSFAAVVPQNADQIFAEKWLELHPPQDANCEYARRLRDACSITLSFNQYSATLPKSWLKRHGAGGTGRFTSVR
jgi:hypothetical protein